MIRCNDVEYVFPTLPPVETNVGHGLLMNVGYIAPVVYPFVKGGAEKRIYEVGRRLADRGHDVTVYSRHWWDGPSSIEHEGMHLRSVGPAKDIYTDGGRRSVTSALNLAVRTVTVANRSHDMLATPVAPYFHVLSSRLASSVQGIPLVVNWHEVWGDYWLQYMGVTGPVGKVVERTIGGIPHNPVTPSELTATRLAAIGPAREDIEVIPNGIDLKAVRNIPPAPEGFDVLYAGRLIDDKNVDLLLRAFDRASEESTLGIIGDGPKREELEGMAASIGCSDRVTFLGFLNSYDDVIAHMRGAPVFVSPSIREGFGMTLLEAMAADCTVITVNHPYSAGSEVVGDAGFVTEPTVEGVQHALERALSGEKPARDPVDAAGEYQWENVVLQTEEYYLGLLEDTGKSR